MGLLHMGTWTLLLSLLLPRSATGLFHVIGPRAPLIAVLGGEVVLSCHLSPSMDAQNIQMTWYHDNRQHVVYYYGDSQDNLQQQRPEYQGRTEFLSENITKGQVALRIHPIHLSDEGMYSCSFVNSTHSDRAQFKVVVTVSGMAPHIHIEPTNFRGIKLTCTSMGWYPEPEVKWRDLQGRALAPDTDTMTTGRDGLVLVETSITVGENSGGRVSCFIRNPILNVEKESHISIAYMTFYFIKMHVLICKRIPRISQKVFCGEFREVPVEVSFKNDDMFNAGKCGLCLKSPMGEFKGVDFEGCIAMDEEEAACSEPDPEAIFQTILTRVQTSIKAQEPADEMEVSNSVKILIQEVSYEQRV
ncbi:butyrophilin-like protein 10 [Otolemur garnettii]|uniref:butyrophilin-like protein 10 n=1 Tax=Otolemur garnettii TaxID=30611 RepID=UPI000C7EFC1B|nr:butyrophilin-like protein 10 [Otolemur garnettii]